jgi:hypothetical protein
MEHIGVSVKYLQELWIRIRSDRHNFGGSVGPADSKSFQPNVKHTFTGTAVIKIMKKQTSQHVQSLRVGSGLADINHLRIVSRFGKVKHSKHNKNADQRQGDATSQCCGSGIFPDPKFSIPDPNFLHPGCRIRIKELNKKVFLSFSEI